MNIIFLVVLLVPIAIFMGFVFADIVSNMRRSNNKPVTSIRTVGRDYEQKEQSNYNKGQNHGKVIKMKYRAVK